MERLARDEMLSNCFKSKLIAMDTIKPIVEDIVRVRILCLGLCLSTNKSFLLNAVHSEALSLDAVI